jgi:GT2 family glycosyltransferase
MTEPRPTVSILVPFKAPGPYLRECVARCLDLEYPDVEIFLLPDEPFDVDHVFVGLPLASGDVRVMATGPMGPAEKRDLAAASARGQVLAFLDDDAYPSREWLTRAAHLLEDETIGAVGGPAVTPPNDSIWQRASGAVFCSWLGGGTARHRYTPGPAVDVDDLPSVNLLVRKDLFNALGGFRSGYWPGEDSKFCLNVLQAGRRLRYDPGVLVWHHRRTLFRSHLKQVAAYALHRGHFSRTGDANSRRPAYFLPSAALLFLAGGVVVSSFVPRTAIAYSAVVGGGAVAVIVSALVAAHRERHLGVGLLAAVGIVTTQLAYGVYFLKGLFTKELSR